MKKLVLGIGLVVCLDLAFIWIMADDAGSSEIVRAVVPRAAMPVGYDKRSLEPVAVEDSDEPAKHIAAIAPPTRRGQSGTKAGYVSITTIGSAPKRSDPPLTAKRLFPDKVILIGQPERSQDSDPTPEVSSVENSADSARETADKAPEPKRRSFESRAIGVIKKPYIWIRALASEFRP